jgi:hypothetical protein
MANVANSEEFKHFLALLVQEINASMNEKLDQILDKINKQQEQNILLQDKVRKLSEEVERNKKEITEIKNQKKSNSYSAAVSSQTYLPETTTATKTTTNVTPQNDRGIRRNNLIITGLEIGSEDPFIFIQGFLSARFSIRPDCVLAVQKLKSSNEEKYLTTMKSAWEAQLIYSRRLQVLKNEKIFISEDLTALEARIFFLARQLKKAGAIHTTWTKDGKVFVRRSFSAEAEEFKEGHPLLSTDPSKSEISSMSVQNHTVVPSLPSPQSPSSQIKFSSFLPSISSQLINFTNQERYPHKTDTEEASLDQQNQENEDQGEECLKLFEGAITRRKRS